MSETGSQVPSADERREPEPDPAAAPGGEAGSKLRSEAVSERVRLRQLARLGALFAGFAHEIRNPLSTIRLNLQLVKEDLGEAQAELPPRIGRRLAVVETEVARLQAILEQFLGYVRVPRLQLRELDLNAMLLDIIEFTGPEVRAKGVAVRFFGAPELGPIRADPDQLRAVVVNLLRNALDACSDGDEILVRTRALPEGALVVVADTGCGMPPDVLERAFQPYFSTKKSGTGLGLPTVRRIVEQHGGSVAVDSEPGRGTQFTIRLPADGGGGGEEVGEADTGTGEEGA
ncbi:MAG: GHKL domain-containing protein [Planctomycetes bacterium]|nr:GHKL domain-containing protein [Planctomycetota bacterium]